MESVVLVLTHGYVRIGFPTLNYSETILGSAMMKQMLWFDLAGHVLASVSSFPRLQVFSQMQEIVSDTAVKAEPGPLTFFYFSASREHVRICPSLFKAEFINFQCLPWTFLCTCIRSQGPDIQVAGGVEVTQYRTNWPSSG